MPRLLILIAILLAALAVGWAWMGGGLTESTSGAPLTELPQAAEGEVSQKAGAAADAAADAAAIAADAAAEAASAAPASDAAREAEAAAEQAIRAADRAADAAAGTGIEDGGAPSPDGAMGAADDASDMGVLLTPEGYDAARVLALIDQAALDPERKAGLKLLLDRAANDPDLLRSALEQVRAALE